jgi:hypothetical protein
MPNLMTETSNNDGHVFDILTDALKLIGGNGMTKQDVLPALIDFVTAVSLIVGAEPAARAMITRIDNRIADWKAGTFPTPTSH